MKNKRKGEEGINTLVGSDTRVHGDIEFSGGCLIDGHVEGNVKSSDENATLNISERGCVEGTVLVPNVFLYGTVKGDVNATNRIELGATARVFGNVQYALIEMCSGAQVNGKLIHESVARQQSRVSAAAETGAKESKRQEQARLEAVAGPATIAKVNVVGE